MHTFILEMQPAISYFLPTYFEVSFIGVDTQTANNPSEIGHYMDVGCKVLGAAGSGGGGRFRGTF